MKIQLALLGLSLGGMLMMWLEPQPIKKLGFAVWTLPLLAMPFMPQTHFWDFGLWIIWGWLTLAAGIVLALWAQMTMSASAGLVTSGPYKFMRHPKYLGFIFIYIGLSWIMSAIYSFYLCVLVIPMIWIEAYLEDKFILEKEFGEQFRKYKQETGMFWFK